MNDPYAPDSEHPGRSPALRAVIMAGGRSERMRATLGPTHKALVHVGGMTLLERNLRTVFDAGLRDVVVVTSRDEPEIDAFVTDRGTELAAGCGARLEAFVEPCALGNIGVAGILAAPGQDLLIVYVDNVTSLRASDLLGRHRTAAAALTIATHFWPLQNPFGELEIADGLVRGYREKPVRHVRISSGTCVVAPAAAALIPAGRPFGAAELCTAALTAGLPVAAYEHDAVWIDVNDAAAVTRAEALVAAHPQHFAC